MKLGKQVGLGTGHIVLDRNPASPPPKGHMGTQPSPQKGGRAPPPKKKNPPCLLWPNGWMDQDGTWHGGRPQPSRLCLRWGHSPLPKRGQSLLSPIFGLFLLRPNDWIHQDATWHGGSLSPGDFVLDGDPAPPQKGGGARQFSAHVYCSQTAAWIKMPLGTEVGLGPGDIVLDEDPAPPPRKGGRALLPNFRPMSILAKRLDGSR